MTTTPFDVVMIGNVGIDTNGAGDSLAVGFLVSRVLEGSSLEESIRRGQITALLLHAKSLHWPFNHPKILERYLQAKEWVMPIPNCIRYVNKWFTNRIMILLAGKKHSPIALVAHVGRRSGTTYRTPIMVERSANEFVFALTYGPRVDWYRNVLAAGRCELRWHGKTYPLVDPVAISQAEGLAVYPNPQRAILKKMNISSFFKMKITPDGQSG